MSMTGARPGWVATLVFLLFSLLLSGCGSDGLRGGPDDQRLPVAVEIFEDASRSVTAKDLQDKPFTPLDRAHANHGYTSSAFWVRMTITSSSNVVQPAVIELTATPSSAELFDAAGALIERSGTALPFGSRPVQHPRIAFRVALSPRASNTVLLRLESRDNLTIDPIVWREAAFQTAASDARLLDGFYYGIIAGLGLYNLFLAYATRERAYLAYVAFQLSTALSIGAIDKYSFQYLWPNHPVWALRSEQVLDLVALAAALLCARWLLDTLRFAPRLDALFRVLSPFALALGIAAAFLDPFPAALFGVAATFGIGIALLVVAAAVVTYRGNPNGRIFLLGWTLLFMGVVGAGLFAVGAVEETVGFSILKAGSAAEAVLLSLGLAARIRLVQEQREAAREALLEERTIRVDSLARLVGGVAHELGNPLNFAKGGAAALSTSLAALPDDVDGKRARRALALVETGLARIARMVEHLRADLDGQQSEAVRVDVVAEVEDGLEVIAPWLSERRVVVRRSGAPAAHVLARPGDLSQVFTNLARNAGSAMANGGMLTIVVREDVGDAVVSFSDEGPGVSARIEARVFEPFFTERAPDAEPGMGLGLFVARQIVERWGGTLTLEREPREGAAQGATFVVRIPLADAGQALSRSRAD